MSKETAPYFAYERNTRHIFDNFYKEQGYACKRVLGKENEKYDCFLKIKNKWWTVEEKMRQSEAKRYNDILVENIQNTETNAEGWIWKTEAILLFYAFDDGTIYSLNMKKLRELVKTNDFNIVSSDKGWGHTENFSVPLDVILDNNIGKLICDKGISLISSDIPKKIPAPVDDSYISDEDRETLLNLI